MADVDRVGRLHSRNKMSSATGGKHNHSEVAKESVSIQSDEFFEGKDYDDVFIDLASLCPKDIPSSLTHSGPFFKMFLSWILFTFVIPAILLTALFNENKRWSDHHLSDTTSTFLRLIIALLFFGGCLKLLLSLKLVIQVLVNCPEPAPCQEPFRQKPRIEKFKHALLVYNPHAGKELADQQAKETIVPGLEAGGMKVTLFKTKSTGDARVIDDKYLEGVDLVIAVGGDGTLHEVFNGLILKNGHKIEGHIPVAIIPMGSGNALYTTCRQNFKMYGKEVSIYDDLTTHMVWSVDSINAGYVSGMDVAEVHFNGRKLAAISNVFCGFGADIDMIAEPFRWMGNVRFDIAAMWQICRLPPCFGSLTLTHLDDSVEELPMGSFIGFTVSLCQHWDETMRTTPPVILDDGTLTISILRSGVTRSQLLAGFLVVDKGAHVQMGRDNAFDIIQVKEIDFRTQKPGYFNIDGEIYKHDGRIQFTRAKNQMQLVGCRDVDEQTSSSSKGAAASQLRKRG